ncbi:MAG: hypothetical protein ACRD68_16915, partial [Pyrinomonadaceae bacterium]
MFVIAVASLGAGGAVAARAAAAAGDEFSRSAPRLAPDISRYEGREIASVEVQVEEAAVDSAAEAQF